MPNNHPICALHAIARCVFSCRCSMGGFALAPPDALLIGLHIIFSAEQNELKIELKSKLLQQIPRCDHPSIPCRLITITWSPLLAFTAKNNLVFIPVEKCWMRFICSIYLLRIRSFAHQPRPDYSKICPLFSLNSLHTHAHTCAMDWVLFFRVSNAVRILVESTEAASAWKKVQLDCALTILFARGKNNPGFRVEKIVHFNWTENKQIRFRSNDMRNK